MFEITHSGYTTPSVHFGVYGAHYFSNTPLEMIGYTIALVICVAFAFGIGLMGYTIGKDFDEPGLKIALFITFGAGGLLLLYLALMIFVDCILKL